MFDMKHDALSPGLLKSIKSRGGPKCGASPWKANKNPLLRNYLTGRPATRERCEVMGMFTRSPGNDHLDQVRGLGDRDHGALGQLFPHLRFEAGAISSSATRTGEPAFAPKKLWQT